MNHDLFHQPDDTPYFNTTHAIGDQLLEYHQKAEDQNDVVMAVMKVRRRMSPSMLVPYFPANTPLTSIRRSMTVLTKRGLLIKLDEKVPGNFGRQEHVWKYPDSNG